MEATLRVSAAASEANTIHESDTILALEVPMDFDAHLLETKVFDLTNGSIELDGFTVVKNNVSSMHILQPSLHKATYEKIRCRKLHQFKLLKEVTPQGSKLDIVSMLKWPLPIARGNLSEPMLPAGESRSSTSHLPSKSKGVVKPQSRDKIKKKRKKSEEKLSKSKKQKKHS